MGSLSQSAFLEVLRDKLTAHNSMKPATLLSVTNQHLIQRYYRAKIVLNELENAVNESYQSKQNTTMGKQHVEMLDSLKMRLTSAEAGEYLMSDKPCPDSSASQDEAINFQTLVRERIRGKLLSLSQFYQPSPPSVGQRVITAKASQLNRVIQFDAGKVRENREAITKLKHLENAQYTTLSQNYLQAMSLMKKLLVKYKMGQQAENDKSDADYLCAKIEAFTAKLKLIETELLTASYTSATSLELQKVRESLDLAVAKTQEELHQTDALHRSCLAAGPEFSSIAREFAQVCKDIEARTWALEELQASRSKREKTASARVNQLMSR